MFIFLFFGGNNRANVGIVDTLSVASFWSMSKKKKKTFIFHLKVTYVPLFTRCKISL